MEMFQIFKDGKLSHFVDGRGTTGNWMSYINNARHIAEQNLTVIQEDNQIFYEVCRDIQCGTELLVWYGDMYLQFMGIPITLKHNQEQSGLPGKCDDGSNSEGFQCERCGKVFAYEYYREKHLKYTKCVDQGEKLKCLAGLIKQTHEVVKLKCLVGLIKLTHGVVKWKCLAGLIKQTRGVVWKGSAKRN
ncbi:hypothetical protein CHS0354_034419 [Potamilus streckersoni]|uniref:Uncharacterized protein n=1 Tax=Potamilus streckersoni TaxID=2493646 RepID=A0AAE0S8N4_9BIVA|nr:hypothetical protein CHS0354_034419 [Potamilus streckersoni]